MQVRIAKPRAQRFVCYPTANTPLFSFSPLHPCCPLSSPRPLAGEKIHVFQVAIHTHPFEHGPDSESPRRGSQRVTACAEVRELIGPVLVGKGHLPAQSHAR